MRLLAAGVAVLAAAVPAPASLDGAKDSIRAARGAVRAELTFRLRGGEYHEARIEDRSGRGEATR
jgi:hypothetical protein